MYDTSSIKLYQVIPTLFVRRTHIIWPILLFQVSNFPKHLIDDTMEKILVCPGVEKKELSMRFEVNFEYVKTFGDWHILSLSSITPEWWGLFLPIDFGEMRSSYLPACLGHSPSQRQRPGHDDLWRSFPTLWSDAMNWNLVSYCMPRN